MKPMKRNIFVLGVMVVLFSLLVGCGPRETLVKALGNAENLVFTPDGRLFVTGEMVWEIIRDGDDYQAVSLTEDMAAVYAGIICYKDHLFVVCSQDKNGDAWLMRAALAEKPEFEKIFQLTGFTIANGMAVDRQGRLYIADETLVNTKGKIIRLSLTDDPAPEVIESSDTIWLSGKQGAQSPNGVTIIGDDLFFTNFDISNVFCFKSEIKKVSVAGDHPGEVETVFSRRAFLNSSLLDDLTSTYYNGKYFLVSADYLKGTILVVEAYETGQKKPLYETEDDKFAGPTSCIIGQGLGFGPMDLLVTEGGIVSIDPDTCFGNRLSIVRYQPY